MLLQITVSACTTPLNFDIPALTVTMLAETSTILAVIVILAEAFTVMPLAWSFIELPLLSTTSTEPGPSCNVIFWPPRGFHDAVFLPSRVVECDLHPVPRA